jgi:dTDP-L-rhamnose 4-epimerase
MKNNTPINVFEDGKETRDFVYIEDVVDATMAGLVTENAEYESYNVGSGSAITVYDIAKKLAKVYNSEVPINITGNFRLGDIRNNVADLTKIKNHLNFSPQYSFENGISHFAAWVNKQDVSQDKSLQSINELKSRGLFK